MNKPACSRRPAAQPGPDDSVDALLRLWILRLLVPLGGYREFICSYGFGDEALALYVGLTAQDSKYDMPFVLGTLRQLHHQREGARTSPGLPAPLSRNIERVSRLLGLDDAAQRIVAFAVLLHSQPWLQRAARQIGRVDASRLIEVLTVVLGLDRACVRQALSPEAALHTSGLLRTGQQARDELPDRLSLPSEHLAERMLHVDADPIDLLGDIVALAAPPRLTLSDYGHLPVLQVLQPYLRVAMDTSRPAVNVLVYGVPGSGKTQLVGALAHSVSSQLFAITAHGPGGDAVDADTRLRAYRAAQGLLKHRRAIILFDEIEDVFNDGLSALGGKSTAHSRKAWMNRTLETNPVPAFWLTNDVGSLDPAFVRRFDVVVEAVLPSGRARQAIIERLCAGFVRPTHLTPLFDAPRLAPAVFERAAGLIRAVAQDFSPDAAGGALLQLVDATLVAQGHGGLVSQGLGLRRGAYDPDAVSADTDLAQLTRGLQQAGAGRLCLYGPPGTGKTAYGRWLAQQLDRPLHARRVSDLVTSYLGETEQNLARAFRQAAQERAVLLIDEVESFLRDRRHAQRGWEVTAVNEMLIQMEAFDGVFIASTNLMDDLDQAALRRFDLKVRFGYLEPAQAWRLLQSTCGALGLDEPTERDREVLRSLATLTPGDFATVERQHRFLPLGGTAAFVAALALECATKKDRAPRSIGFAASAC